MIDTITILWARLSALHESDSAAVHGRGGADKGDIAALIDAANSCTPSHGAAAGEDQLKVRLAFGLARRCRRESTLDLQDLVSAMMSSRGGAALIEAREQRSGRRIAHLYRSESWEAKC